MSTDAPQTGLPLATLLSRRLLQIAGVVLLINMIAIGLYYGSDRRALETEVVANQVERISASLMGSVLPQDATVRRLYAEHPTAYAFALIDRGGDFIDAMNPQLIPPGVADLYADDWITRVAKSGAPRLVAGHEFEERDDGLRMVFVMAEDPARLLWRAYIHEFYEHVWLPILPLVLLLIVANAWLIRRGLEPISAAASWARELRPGAPTPPPHRRMPSEIADLIQATQRSIDRLNQALEAEKRHAAEAAHALRTPVAVLMARVDGLPPGEATDQLRADLRTLARTVQQVLASSRAEGLSTRASIDLRLAAETVVGALAPFAYAQGATLSLELPKDPVLAFADAEAVELALTNLLENAILHGGVGPIEVTVGPGPIAIVRDHGPGLPELSPRRLFEPFWRGPGAVAGGAGLGLTIVERLQTAQGGSVEARNAPDGGAQFELRWPAA